MSDPVPHSYSDLAIASAILTVAGWSGLVLLFIFTIPTVGPQWAFYLLWVVALTGTAVPFVRYLNRRFSAGQPAPSAVLLRQSLWVGIFGATMAWLQISRVLTLPIALLIAAALAAIEWFIRLRERSRWVPEDE